MPMVNQLPSGRWRVRWRDRNGRKVGPTPPQTFAKEKIARTYGLDREAAVRRGETYDPDPGELLLKTWVADWLENRVAAHAFEDPGAPEQARPRACRDRQRAGRHAARADRRDGAAGVGEEAAGDRPRTVDDRWDLHHPADGGVPSRLRSPGGPEKP